MNPTLRSPWIRSDWSYAFDLRIRVFPSRIVPDKTHGRWSSLDLSWKELLTDMDSNPLVQSRTHTLTDSLRSSFR